MKRFSMILLPAFLCIFFLSGCAGSLRVQLPPLPTPHAAEEAEEVTMDLPAEIPSEDHEDPFTLTQTEEVGSLVETASGVQEETGEIPGAEAQILEDSEPAPEAMPEPTPEDPNIPHMYMDGATYPESMTQGGIAQLLGDIYTDKGVIALVRGCIVDENGTNVQQCNFFPYEPHFSLAGTVNAKLVFGQLQPGSYRYVVTAIAENNSYSNGEEVLIDHPFEIYYP